MPTTSHHRATKPHVIRTSPSTAPTESGKKASGRLFGGYLGSQLLTILDIAFDEKAGRSQGWHWRIGAVCDIKRALFLHQVGVNKWAPTFTGRLHTPTPLNAPLQQTCAAAVLPPRSATASRTHSPSGHH